jgi:DNA invertase Pin-like site-specific DNA recombinase
MVYGYVRVSTDKQDCENQKLGVNTKAAELGVTVEKWIEDHGVSGTKEPEKRQLGALLKKVKRHDTIIISELSRFGRSLYMVMKILEGLSKNEVFVYSHKDNFKLENTIESKVIAFAFSIAAEIERDMISRRTKEALDRKRNAGLVLGRPLGSKSSKRKLDDKEQQIIEYLNKGLSYSAIARLTGSHRITVRNFVERHDLSKYRTNFLSNSYAAEERAKLRIRPATPATDLLDREIIELYKKCRYSLTSMAKEIGMSCTSLRTMLKKRNLFEKIKEISESQRQKVKSSYQIAQELGISREDIKKQKN